MKNILRKENIGYSSTVITNVHLSTSNGNPLLQNQRSPESDGIRTSGNNAIANMIESRLVGKLEKANDRSKFEKVFVPGTDVREYSYLVQDTYNQLREKLGEIRKEANLWRNDEVDSFLQSRGLSLDDIRNNNQKIDKIASDLRKMMQARGKQAGDEDKLDDLKSKRNPQAKYNIVITTQIMEVFNKDPLAGESVDIPVDAVVDTMNPNVYRRFTFKQVTVIPYRLDYYNKVIDLLGQEYDGIRIQEGSEVTLEHLNSPLDNVIGKNNWYPSDYDEGSLDDIFADISDVNDVPEGNLD